MSRTGLLLQTASPETVRAARPKGSLVRKLTLLVGLTMALLLAVLLAGSWFYWRAVVRKIVESHLSGVAASRRDMVQAQISQLLQRVELNTDRGEMRGFLYELETKVQPSRNRDPSQVSLQRIADGKPIVAAAIVDTTGTVVLSTDPAEVGRDLQAAPEFTAGLAGPHLGPPRWRNGRFEASLAAPIRTRVEPNRVYGVLLTTADVSPLAATLNELTPLGKTGEVILGAREGSRIHFLFPPRNSPQTTAVRLASAPALDTATHGLPVFLRGMDYRGVQVLAAARPLDYGGWSLVVKMDEEEAYAPIAKVMRLGVVFGLVVGAMGLGVAYLLARAFVRPVRQLAAAAARVAGGDYDAPVLVNSRDELGALAISFNEMTAAIRSRRAERDQAEEALREADRHKDEFLAMLGHELRNPLSAIVNAVRLLKEAPGERETSDLAQMAIERQTGNLSRHVDDLLDVVRISEGKIELRREPMDIAETIRDAAGSIRTVIEEKRQTLELLLTGDRSGCINADRTRIEQILTNLLGNAVKYTPNGGRIIVVERRAGDEVIVTVSDNGIGIAPDLLPKIFDLFTQADRSLERSTGGLGIGLNLCRQLAELHGGSVSARSSGLGAGAEFTVRLPALRGPLPAAVAPKAAVVTPHSRSRRILLVDDNKDTLQLLSRLLIRRGHEVCTIGDGLAALQVARDFQPDILLLDIGLPGLDGYSLARRLRADGFASSLMIAISGYAQDGDRALAHEAGFDHHFAKPVDFDALLALLAAEPTRSS